MNNKWTPLFISSLMVFGFCYPIGSSINMWLGLAMGTLGFSGILRCIWGVQSDAEKKKDKNNSQ